jgi:hypothetical protein
MITNDFPLRGTVLSTPATTRLIDSSWAQGAIPLLDWAEKQKAKPDAKQRHIAAVLVRDHMMLHPYWEYGYDDLTEYRHGGCLAEFGWELLLP